MKYIFDFDDVIFQTTRRRKEFIFPFLEKKGIPISELENYYKNERTKNFSLKSLLAHFSLSVELYEELMSNSMEFANKELIELIKKLGKDNCYIVTYGENEFQLDKIKSIGVDVLFSAITTTSGQSKNEPIEKICEKHKDETVIFVDDKIKHFEDLDMNKCPNLKTILFDEQGLDKLKLVIQ